MTKILFIDLDDVFVLDKAKYLGLPEHEHYRNWPYMHHHDPFAAEFISNLFVKNTDLYGVLHSTWRQTASEWWIKKHFEVQNTFVRWHQDWMTDPDLARYQSITKWLEEHDHIKRDQWAIIDDEKPPETMKSRTVRIDPNHGFGNKEVTRLIQLLQANYK